MVIDSIVPKVGLSQIFDNYVTAVESCPSLMNVRHPKY